MEQLMRVILWTHAGAGFLALFAGPVAMLTLKGGKVHRRFGKYYFWMMAVVCATALPLAFYRPIFFLAMVAVFSFYFAFRGYRVLQTKRTGAGALDWAAALITGAVGLGLLAAGIWQPKALPMPAPAISIVFGLLALGAVAPAIYSFVRPPADRNEWWYAHMSGMLGSYIGTVSAFSAVNLEFIPMPWRWLWPTIIGGPGIFLWILYYKRKFRPKQAEAVVTGA